MGRDVVAQYALFARRAGGLRAGTARRDVSRRPSAFATLRRTAVALAELASGLPLSAVLLIGPRVDRQSLTRADLGAVQAIPLLQRADAGLERPRDRRQRVTAPHAIDMTHGVARSARRHERRALHDRTRVARRRRRPLGLRRHQRRGRQRDDQLLARADPRAYREVVRFGEIGPADAQLARDRQQRLARLHRVPVQRGALGRRQRRRVARERRPPSRPAPSARSACAAHRRRPAAQLRVERLDLVDRRVGPLGDAAQIDRAAAA